MNLPSENSFLIRDRMIRSEREMEAMAAAIAPLAIAGDVFALWGGLGCGKTVFARGFIRELTAKDEEIPSPTFTLVQTYSAHRHLRAPIYHFDLFRLCTPDEAIELGIEDAFSVGITLIEWPDRIGSYLPDEHLDVILDDNVGADSRTLSVAGSTSWSKRLKEAHIV
jgi:tRNA threonylcarbamoyladenosine biosynthesis protein TsaE